MRNNKRADLSIGMLIKIILLITFFVFMVAIIVPEIATLFNSFKEFMGYSTPDSVTPYTPAGVAEMGCDELKEYFTNAGASDPQLTTAYEQYIGPRKCTSPLSDNLKLMIAKAYGRMNTEDAAKKAFNLFNEIEKSAIASGNHALAREAARYRDMIKYPGTIAFEEAQELKKEIILYFNPLLSAPFTKAEIPRAEEMINQAIRLYFTARYDGLSPENRVISANDLASLYYNWGELYRVKSDYVIVGSNDQKKLLEQAIGKYQKVISDYQNTQSYESAKIKVRESQTALDLVNNAQLIESYQKDLEKYNSLKSSVDGFRVELGLFSKGSSSYSQENLMSYQDKYKSELVAFYELVNQQVKSVLNSESNLKYKVLSKQIDELGDQLLNCDDWIAYGHDIEHPMVNIRDNLGLRRLQCEKNLDNFGDSEVCHLSDDEKSCIPW
jgi:hypothetical protein